MSDSDYALALKLQEEFNRSPSHCNELGIISNNRNLKTNDSFGGAKPKTKSLVDPEWELIDPTPDIYALFAQFNQEFFWGKLDAVELKWSPKMTSCAGVCSYEGKRSGMCSVRLSLPLLKLRPRKDLIETLLHEMIHAYLFVTHNDKDHDGHGPEFHKHMYRINNIAGTKITVYHNFHDEVDLYKVHWWQCDGSCKNKRPFYGLVKRAINRAPGPYDTWWAEHQLTCGGTFVKIKDPGNKSKSDIQSKRKISDTAPNSNGSPKKLKTLDDFVAFKGRGNILGSNSTNNIPIIFTPPKPKLPKSSRTKSEISWLDPPASVNSKNVNAISVSSNWHRRQKLFSSDTDDEVERPRFDSTDSDVFLPDAVNVAPHMKRPVYKSCSVPSENEVLTISDDDDDLVLGAVGGAMGLPKCPICEADVLADQMNEHLDLCLNKDH